MKTKPRLEEQRRKNNSKKRLMTVAAWLLFFIGIIALVWVIFAIQKPDEGEIETVTREGVVTQIQQLNRLQTVAFSVDTIITSEREGSWQRFWTDEQKALFIAKGRVQAGIDLSTITPEMVQVVQPDPEVVAAWSQANAAGNDDNQARPASVMPQVTITIPPSEIFAVYLDDIEIYDWQTGAFNMMQVDPKILDEAQTMAKAEVLERACRGDVMTLALNNAQSQIQQLFAMTGATVTVNTQGTGACRMPVQAA